MDRQYAEGKNACFKIADFVQYSEISHIAWGRYTMVRDRWRKVEEAYAQSWVH